MIMLTTKFSRLILRIGLCFAIGLSIIDTGLFFGIGEMFGIISLIYALYLISSVFLFQYTPFLISIMIVTGIFTIINFIVAVIFAWRTHYDNSLVYYILCMITFQLWLFSLGIFLFTVKFKNCINPISLIELQKQMESEKQKTAEIKIEIEQNNKI